MNYKLEKFWNKEKNKKDGDEILMNYKLEKFWNNLVTLKIAKGKNEL